MSRSVESDPACQVRAAPPGARVGDCRPRIRSTPPPQSLVQDLEITPKILGSGGDWRRCPPENPAFKRKCVPPRCPPFTPPLQ